MQTISFTGRDDARGATRARLARIAEEIGFDVMPRVRGKRRPEIVVFSRLDTIKAHCKNARLIDYQTFYSIVDEGMSSDE